MSMAGMDDSAMGVAAPGATIAYTWPVPERAGPGPADGSSVVWPYHSHVDEPRDVNSGLAGAIIVTEADRMRSDGRPVDVDREFVVLFNIFDENLSWYLEDNMAKAGLPDSLDAEGEDFRESNLKHSMNGYLYSNLPGLTMHRGERVRWYLIGLGTETDIHTPHWHGNTVLVGGHRADTGELFPATTAVYDMVPDDPGTWMFHCHVNDHLEAGMVANYTVLR
jgi:hephaestin